MSLKLSYVDQAFRPLFIGMSSQTQPHRRLMPRSYQILTPPKKACSEARPRADFRTRGWVRELSSVDSIFNPLLVNSSFLAIPGK